MNKIFIIIIVILAAIGTGLLAHLLINSNDLEKEKIETVEIFFNNIQKTPEMLDCSEVFSVKREVVLSEKESVFSKTLETLLQGLTEEELEQGYLNSINQGTELLNFEIRENIAVADFNKRIAEGIAGSCRIQAIRAQITKTLLQFPEIQEVVIKVEGEAEGVLEP